MWARGCYREITAYWRYAIELFPVFDKQQSRLHVFCAASLARTFSLLPVQLIPYHQYTAGAVLGALVLGLGCWQAGEKSFCGAALAVDPDSLLTPYLVACWLAMAVRGLRRAHGALCRSYDLRRCGPSKRTASVLAGVQWVPARLGLEAQSALGPLGNGAAWPLQLACTGSFSSVSPASSASKSGPDNVLALF